MQRVGRWCRPKFVSLPCDLHQTSISCASLHESAAALFRNLESFVEFVKQKTVMDAETPKRHQRNCEVKGATLPGESRIVVGSPLFWRDDIPSLNSISTNAITEHNERLSHDRQLLNAPRFVTTDSSPWIVAVCDQL
jgi:hypothetical protein